MNSVTILNGKINFVKIKHCGDEFQDCFYFNLYCSYRWLSSISDLNFFGYSKNLSIINSKNRSKSCSVWTGFTVYQFITWLYLTIMETK